MRTRYHFLICKKMFGQPVVFVTKYGMVSWEMDKNTWKYQRKVVTFQVENVF